MTTTGVGVQEIVDPKRDDQNGHEDQTLVAASLLGPIDPIISSAASLLGPIGPIISSAATKIYQAELIKNIELLTRRLDELDVAGSKLNSTTATELYASATRLKDLIDQETHGLFAGTPPKGGASEIVRKISQRAEFTARRKITSAWERARTR